jgi:hypothetical protein
MAAHLLTLEAPVLCLALLAHLVALEAASLRLALHAHLLPVEATILRVPLHAELLLRMLDRKALSAAMAMLARHGEPLHPGRSETAAAVAMSATAAEGREARTAAASTVPAATAEGLEVRVAAAVTATPAMLLLRGRTAASAVRIAATAATAVAASGLRCRGACNRQCGDARGEEQPGHGISPFERGKTARKPHRSNV